MIIVTGDIKLFNYYVSKPVNKSHTEFEKQLWECNAGWLSLNK